MHFIGIDNGLDGGIAVIRDHKVVDVMVAPVIKGPKRRAMDEPTMMQILQYFSPCVCVIEQVQSMPGNKAGAMLNYGIGHGLWRGMCVGLKIPYAMVHPKTWQKQFGITGAQGDLKAQSIQMVQRLYPGIDLRPTERSKKPHDGMADAVLIARWGESQGIM